MALARGGVLALTFAVSASALCADLKKRLAEVDYDALAVGSDIRLPAAGSGPQQVHLSLTGDVTEMYVTFVTPESALCADAVATLLDGDKPPSPFPAKNQTYSAGIVGWTGVIYTSTFTGLMPGAFYSYTVRACGTETTPVRGGQGRIAGGERRRKPEGGTSPSLTTTPFSAVQLHGRPCTWSQRGFACRGYR